MVQRKVTYRLYPTKRQIEALERLRWVHCLLWNTALDERRRAWQEARVSLSFSDQCKVSSPVRLYTRFLKSSGCFFCQFLRAWMGEIWPRAFWGI